MKNKLQIVLFILLIATGAQAQDNSASATVKEASYTIGKPYVVVDAPVKKYFYKDDELMTVKIKGAKIIIQKIGTKGDLEFKSVHEYKEMPKGFQLEGVEEIGDKYYLFYSVYDKPNKSEQLFCRSIEFSNGELNEDEKPLLKTDGKVTRTGIGVYRGTYGPSFSYSTGSKFDFFRSFDNSKFMINYRKAPEEKNDAINYDKIGMFIYDENMEPIWGDEIKMPYTEKKMNNVDYAVDKEGNSYILAQVYNDNSTDAKKRKDANANYHIEILRIPTGSKNVKKSDIDKTSIAIKDKFIQTIGLYEGPEDYMICAGYYNKGKDLDAANGVFQFKIGKDGDLYDTKTYEIPVNVLNQYVSERTQAKNERKEKQGKSEFSDLVLRNFYIGADGSIVLVGEQYWVDVVYTRTGGTTGSTTTTYYYNYNDILITKIGADGELAWMQKLPKRQRGSNKGRSGMSYKYMYDEETKNHYLVFIDNLKNMKLDMNTPPKQHLDGSGGFLTAYEVAHDDGAVSKVSILDTRNAKGARVTQFDVDRIFKTGPGEFVFEAYKKKKEDILIKVDINQ